MSEKKREPLLSDAELGELVDVRVPGRGVKRYYAECAAEEVRYRYERLIDEGKLIVVEEVEWSSKKPGCERCGHPWSLLLRQSIFCPGCGGKIKR